MLSRAKIHAQNIPRLTQSRPVLQVRKVSSTTSAQPTGTTLRNAVYGTLLLGGAGLFTVYYFDARAGIHRYVITPALRRVVDAETGHKLAVRVLAAGLAPRDPVADDSLLRTELWGESMPNPVGLAAGFDKDGEAIDGLFGLGFGWVEVGSVTPKAQPGNPKPRVFHLTDDSALINRYGFPSQGHAPLLKRLESRSQLLSSKSGSPRSVLAVNLGKNKSSAADDDSDYISGIRTFAPHSHALVINVSSPNTPGLRGLQDPVALDRLLGACTAELASSVNSAGHERPKLLLKIAPDLDGDAIRQIAGIVVSRGIDGVIVSNTTISRPSHLSHPHKTEIGGLSGPPVKPLALAAVHALRANLPANVPIIGCGGVSTGADALDFARAGASAIQMYTAFGYDGPGAARRVKDELIGLLKKEGKSWNEVVKESVGRTALKTSEVLQVQPVPIAVAGEKQVSEVGKLIKEAEEIQRKLKDLEARS